MAAIFANKINILKVIFFKEDCGILINISLKFIPNGPINNKPALVQIIAWCWTLPSGGAI